MRSAIADIMVEFAGAASFAADINFFDAAGTSICAMRVVMAIARNWGVGIPLDAFVATPTAADLARAVTTGGKARAFDPLVALRSSGETTARSLSCRSYRRSSGARHGCRPRLRDPLGGPKHPRNRQIADYSAPSIIASAQAMCPSKPSDSAISR
jgi:Phosphopantetheine attachment site